MRLAWLLIAGLPVGCSFDWSAFDPREGAGGSSTGGAPEGGQGGAETLGSCKDVLEAAPASVDGRYAIEPSLGGARIDVECDMITDGGGWTLIYNRLNAYFTPDHMHHELPPEGPTLTTNSASWFIPDDAVHWRWEVSIDDGSTFLALTTDIPAEARADTSALAIDVPVTLVSDTVGASEPIYYQSFTVDETCLYGCSTGSATWFGLVNAVQGTGDVANPGIGGHSDDCDLGMGASMEDNYTFGSADLEVYWSDWKDVDGNGGGGTFCSLADPSATNYRLRMWTR